MSKILSRPRRKTSQSGITLIMAVLVLATVSILSFSLGALVLREIKASRLLSRSEPAIVAAEAGGETALFFRIRNLTTYAGATVACPSYTSVTLNSGSFNICTNYYDNPYIFDTSSSSKEVIVLFDPVNTANIAAGYSSLLITATSGTAVSVNVEAYDLAAENPTPLTTSVVVGGASVSLAGLNPDTSYAVFLNPVGPGANPAAGGCVIANVGSGGCAPGAKGIPAKNPSISSTGFRDSLIRKLEIKLGR